MSDLISRSAVIDIIHKEIERTTSFAEHQTQINIEMAVKELPIAYDKEAVVEQLVTCDPQEMMSEDERNVLNYAIEIVKAGGIDEM